MKATFRKRDVLTRFAAFGGRQIGRAALGITFAAILLGVAGRGLAGVADPPAQTRPDPAPRVLVFDRAALHAQALAESLVPIHPGVPGKQPFWNGRAGAFIYAPAFDFAPVQGAGIYRFTATAGEKSFTFEAQAPWASLVPIWRDIPVGKVDLKVEGLDGPGGRVIALARIDGKQARTFYRKAVFNGPYHQAAWDYDQSARRWLKWLSEAYFKTWDKEGDPQRLQGYPSKFIGGPVSGLVALAELADAPAQKADALRRAANAARTLIKGSFPADWPLAGCPPTYANRAKSGPGNYDTVMMLYPASAADAYLDLYEATDEKEFLDAARVVADLYKKTQLPTGAWPLLMDGKTGQPSSANKSNLMPIGPLTFLKRLIERHGLKEYQPLADGAWRWIKENLLATFLFEGQFEDTCLGGGSGGNLSHVVACQIAAHMLRHAGEDPDHVRQAEEILRFAEDQFVVWEQATRDLLKGGGTSDWSLFTPSALEQYRYMVPINASAAGFIRAYQAAYEATGKELYLAKAVAFANATTVLQKESGGRFVNTYWKVSTQDGGWVNCHTYCARVMADLARLLRARGLVLPPGPPTTSDDGGR